jgi:predicted murein hydrolase (TIGR00659 family)
LLTASALVIGVLLIFKIPYESYNNGASMLSYLLAPVTVALAVPLYKKFEYIKKSFLPILIGITVGVCVSIVFIYYVSLLFGLSDELTVSLLPKSVTAPISQAISAEFGGIPSITVFATILTGIVGGIVGPITFKLLNIKDPIAQGIGLGTASHGGGTAKAIEMGEIQGSTSGLAMGVAGIITAILFPVFYNYFF